MRFKNIFLIVTILFVGNVFCADTADVSKEKKKEGSVCLQFNRGDSAHSSMIIVRSSLLEGINLSKGITGADAEGIRKVASESDNKLDAAVVRVLDAWLKAPKEKRSVTVMQLGGGKKKKK